MVLKTELVETDGGTVLHLVGRITSPEVERLRAQTAGAVVLDLEQVDLIDLEAARFLAAAELRGIELRHVPRYIREWIHLEKPRIGND